LPDAVAARGGSDGRCIRRRGGGAVGGRREFGTDPGANCRRRRYLCARARGAAMTVHFIGAGPGAADLITLRGRDLLARCPVCLYAGSIVPREMLAHCRAGTRLVDTAPLSLDKIEAEYVAAHAAGQDVARLHSGALSVFSAVA